MNGFLHPDEAYYWAWSLKPDWAYYDQGPGIAYYILFFTTLFGNTWLALKVAALFAFIPVLSGIYFSARELGLGPRRSGLAIAGFALCPGVFTGSGLIVHDTVLLIFWTLALYCMILYLRRRSLWSFYLVFLFLGFGALSKHSMGGFALGLAFWFVFQKYEYYLLKSKHLWLACGLTLLLLFPIFYWNHLNNWDQIGAILNLRSSGGSFAKGNTAEFIFGQMGLLSPFWFFAFSGIVIMIVINKARHFSFSRWKPDTREIAWFDFIRLYSSKFRLSVIEYFSTARWSYNHNTQKAIENEMHRNSAFWMVFWNAIVLLIFFGILSRSRNIQANWLIPSYPAIFILLAAYLPVGKGLHVEIRPFFKRIYVSLLAIGIFPVIILAIYPFYGHQISKSLNWNIPTEMFIQYKTAGYLEMIQSINKLRQEIDPEAKIIANRYQDAAIAQWYLPGNEFVSSMNISQKNQYSYWASLQKGKNYFIFISQDDVASDFDLGLSLWFPYMFSEVKEVSEKTIDYNQIPIKKYKVWYAKNFRVEWYEILAIYLDRIAILDLLPSMRGYDKGLNSKSNQASIQKFMLLHKQKKNCKKLKVMDRILRAIINPSNRNKCKD